MFGWDLEFLPVNNYITFKIQAWIAQLVAHGLGNMEVVGSNLGKGEDFSKKI